jgi:hypothetical protein
LLSRFLVGKKDFNDKSIRAILKDGKPRNFQQMFYMTDVTLDSYLEYDVLFSKKEEFMITDLFVYGFALPFSTSNRYSAVNCVSSGRWLPTMMVTESPLRFFVSRVVSACW